MGKRNHNRGQPGKWIRISDLYPYEVPSAMRQSLKRNKDKVNREDLESGLALYYEEKGDSK